MACARCDLALEQPEGEEGEVAAGQSVQVGLLADELSGACARCHLALEQPEGEDGDRREMAAALVQVAVAAASWSWWPRRGEIARGEVGWADVRETGAERPMGS